MAKNITAIEARVGKRGRPEVMQFSGSMATEEIEAYKKEIGMVHSDLEAYKESASASAAAAEESYESVKDAIVSGGYAHLYMGTDGHLYVYRSDAADKEIDFNIVDNKNLEVTFA